MAVTMDQGNGERELIQALARAAALPADRNCPAKKLLENFATARIRDLDTQNQILAHLSRCDDCMAVILATRRKGSVETRGAFKPLLQKMHFALASAVLLAIVLLLWYSHRDRQKHIDVAVLDLRSDVMRGPETTFKVRRQKTHLILKLPAGSPEGIYQLAVLKEDSSTAALHCSGAAQRRSGDVELEIDLNFAHLATGHYLLAVWRDNANQLFQPLLVQ